MSKKNKQPLIWMDMEMTGLDPDKERIIEVAALITDGELNLIEEGPNLVIHQPNKILQAMDEWNQKHHKKSGLIEAVEHSKVTVRQAEKLMLDFVKKYCKPKKSPLCGNSIHHDRRFLMKHMPKLNEYIHYRHVDVSTIKDLVRRWYPKDKSKPKKKSKHRALDDIRESIEELRYYREKYFKKLTEV